MTKVSSAVCTVQFKTEDSNASCTEMDHLLLEAEYGGRKVSAVFGNSSWSDLTTRLRMWFGKVSDSRGGVFPLFSEQTLTVYLKHHV